MKKLQTRAISLLLSLVMVASLLPTTVWAADTASPIMREEWSSNYYTPRNCRAIPLNMPLP